jgi:hypothetical protein
MYLAAIIRALAKFDIYRISKGNSLREVWDSFKRDHRKILNLLGSVKQKSSRKFVAKKLAI